MSDKSRMKLAALITALFLAAVCSAGLIAHNARAPVQISARGVVSAQPAAPAQPNFSSSQHDPEHD